MPTRPKEGGNESEKLIRSHCCHSLAYFSLVVLSSASSISWPPDRTVFLPPKLSPHRSWPSPIPSCIMGMLLSVMLLPVLSLCSFFLPSSLYSLPTTSHFYLFFDVSHSFILTYTGICSEALLALLRFSAVSQCPSLLYLGSLEAPLSPLELPLFSHRRQRHFYGSKT